PVARRVGVLPSSPRVFSADDTDRLVKLVQGPVHPAVRIAEPKALNSLGGVALALVVAKDREPGLKLHAVARVVKAHRHRQIALGRVWGGRGQLEHASKNGVLAVLARFARGPDGLKNVRRHLDIAHDRLLVLVVFLSIDSEGDRGVKD